MTLSIQTSIMETLNTERASQSRTVATMSLRKLKRDGLNILPAHDPGTFSKYPGVRSRRGVPPVCEFR